MVYKLVAKILVMVGLMFGVSNYIMYVMTGKSPFSAEMPSLSIPSILNTDSALPSTKDTAYKWTDEKGVVHYSSEPPPETTQQVKKLEVDPNVNLIQGLDVPEGVAPTATPSNDTLVTPYTPTGAQKLLEDAKDVQRILDERFERQKAIIDAE
ncbi:DUF4124 domain-containing protein [Teredinibacter purpureus]|uniref:DUF4124 domain-containing protein n=1 Tax=Teredinibacter purpureus TaxID=2731756 RepID=UPI000697714E|nr:DUF4124 domain-containing protein [Teredinibacter purpureus]